MKFKYFKYFLLTLAAILVDQAVKLYVHYNMVLGQSGEIPVFGNWFKLHYILNEGMAFGISFGSEWGKLGLTLFRMTAMIFIGVYLYKLAKKNMPSGLLWSIALILGGAVGNVIDSIFYGVYLNNAPY
ncbi:MAG: signal peptidase II, partial [Roseivirga sp.]